MHCTNCGAQLPEGSSFCTNCGAQIGQEEPKTFCTNCGTSVSVTASTCPACGQSLSEPKPAKKPINKKLFLYAGIAVATILVAVLLISLLGNTMPQDGLEKLIDNGNFTLCYDDFEIKVDLDVDKEELTLVCEVDGEITYAIYDGYMIYSSYYFGYYCYDISDELEELFEAYKEYDDADWEEMLEILLDMYSFIDMDDVHDYVNVDKLAKCMDTFEKKLANTSWLKKNAGYSTSTKNGIKYHTYKPNVYTLATASLKIFENAFQDDDDYEDLLDELKDMKKDLKDIDITIKLGTKGGYLVSAEIKYDGSKFKVTVDDIGSTKIKTSELEDILDDYA